MASHEFFFALEVFSQGAPASLIQDLASQVFQHVGCSPASAHGLTEAFERAVAPGAAGAHRRCDVQFRAHDGTLDVLVSANGGRVWQQSLPIP